MLEHVRQGGKPYDIRGNHIVTIVNEMNLLSRFRRANQGKIFEGETQHLVEQATHYYETLQNNLKSLSTTRGYSKYFESWDPAALTDEDVIIEDLRHMFIEQNIDSRIEQALPLLARFFNLGMLVAGICVDDTLSMIDVIFAILCSSLPYPICLTNCCISGTG